MKRLTILILSVFVSSIGYGQMTVGPRVGVTFSQLGSDSPYEIWKSGVVFGGILNVPLNNEMSVQGEVLVSQKGYRFEFDGDNSYDQLTSSYLEIPLLFNYKYSFGEWNVFGNAGLYAAYWQSGTYESQIGDGEIIEEPYEFLKDFDADGYKDNRLDYGPAFGFGVLYDKVGTSGNFVLEFRYGLGLAPIGSVENEPPNYTELKNRSFSISLAYMLYL